MDTALIKEIEIQKKFATATYKNFVALRYGMKPCCILDAEAAALDKELCDWQSKLSCETTCVEEVASQGYLTSTAYTEPVKQVVSSDASCPSVTYCPDNSVLENILSSIQDINKKLENADLDEDSFEFVQNDESTTWFINHDLGKYPNIRMELFDGTDINGQVTNIDKSNMEVNFDVPVAGKAFLS